MELDRVKLIWPDAISLYGDLLPKYHSQSDRNTISAAITHAHENEKLQAVKTRAVYADQLVWDYFFSEAAFAELAHTEGWPLPKSIQPTTTPSPSDDGHWLDQLKWQIETKIDDSDSDKQGILDRVYQLYNLTDDYERRCKEVAFNPDKIRVRRSRARDTYATALDEDSWTLKRATWWLTDTHPEIVAALIKTDKQRLRPLDLDYETGQDATVAIEQRELYHKLTLAAENGELATAVVEGERVARPAVVMQWAILQELALPSILTDAYALKTHIAELEKLRAQRIEEGQKHENDSHETNKAVAPIDKKLRWLKSPPVLIPYVQARKQLQEKLTDVTDQEIGLWLDHNDLSAFDDPHLFKAPSVDILLDPPEVSFCEIASKNPAELGAILHGCYFDKEEVEAFTPRHRWLNFEQTMEKLPGVDKYAVVGYLGARIKDFNQGETLTPWCFHPLLDVERAIHDGQLPVEVGLQPEHAVEAMKREFLGATDNSENEVVAREGTPSAESSDIRPRRPMIRKNDASYLIDVAISALEQSNQKTPTFSEVWAYLMAGKDTTGIVAEKSDDKGKPPNDEEGIRLASRKWLTRGNAMKVYNRRFEQAVSDR